MNLRPPRTGGAGAPLARTSLRRLLHVRAAAILFLLVTLAPDAGAQSTRPDESAYSAALSLFYAGDYARARDSFEDIFSAYPGSPLSSRLSYWLGACSLKRGELEKALGRFTTQLAIGGGFYAVHSRLLSGVCLEGLGRIDEAAAIYRRILTDPSADALKAEAVFRLAGAEYSRGRLAEAGNLYARVLLEYPASGFASEALFFLAESELALGRPAEAEKRYRTLISLYPASSRLHRAALRIAEIESRDGRDNDALEEAMRLTASSGPERAAAERLVGDILIRRGDAAKALEAYARALSLMTDPVELQRTEVSAAAVLTAVGRGVEAEGMLDRASRGPDRGEAESAAKERVVLLAGRGADADAQAAAERFLIDFPSSASRERMLVLFARLSDRLGDAEPAWRSWDSLVSGYPDSAALPEALYRRARDSLSLGREPAALEDLQRIGREHADSAYYLPSLYEIGMVYAGHGEYARALPVFRSILKHAGTAAGDGAGVSGSPDASPDIAARALLASGICRFNLGLYAEALSDFDSLSGASSGAAADLPSLYAARALYRMNRLDEASVRFAALDRSTDAAIAAAAGFWRGWCRYRQGDYAEARAAFLSLAERYPEDPRVAESLLRAAVSSAQLSDDEAAVQLLDRALARMQSGSSLREEALYQKGLALFRLSRPEEGRAALEALSREIPGSPLAAEAFFTQASKALERGDVEEALSGFLMVRDAFPASPLSAQAVYWAAEAALQAGREEQAVELFWSVVRAPSMAAYLGPAVDGLERAVAASGSPQLARSCVEAARGAPEIPDDALSALELAYAGLLLENDAKEASAVVDGVLSRKLPDPLLARAMFLRARQQQLSGGVSAARDAFRVLASRMDRVGAEALLAYAGILEAGGQTKTAVDCYEAVADRFPAFPDLAVEGLYSAARLAGQKGDAARAGELERRFQKEYAGTPWVKWLRMDSKAR